MRFLACLALLACCLSLTGCSLFGKRSGTRPTAGAGGGASGGASIDRTPSTPTALDRNNPPSQFGGILAGQVVDAYGTRHSWAYIQVVAAKDQGSAAPIEVETDQNGYFTIPGLHPGKAYQLTARTREAGKLAAAGTTYATPPNPRVLIRVSEEFVSPSTPPLPPYPVMPGTEGPTKPAVPPEQPKKPVATLDRPLPNGGAPAVPVDPPPSPARSGVELMPPRSVPGASPENFVREEPPRGPNTPRPATIPSPGSTPAPPPVPVPVPSPGMGSTWQPPAQQVPFCLVSNQKLDNFALYDVNGQPWEFRRNNHARLVLLDFWGTWCMPCKAALPHLIGLQRQYGQQGLDVIGIAYEEGTPDEQVRTVKRTRDLTGINYRLLLGAGAEKCPVKSQLGVAGFPTLILLDEHGHLLWRSEGLDPAKTRQLEGEIRRRLGVR